MHSVIHIIVDDLRPELGAYGVPNRHTPNIDKLAATGTVFDRAYCQQAVCGPSRSSFLTGRRPDTARVWNFIDSFRTDHPEWTTLPGLFLREGTDSLSLGAGKVFHPKMPLGYDTNRSWSDWKGNLPFKNECWNTASSATSKACTKVGPADASCDGGLPCVPCPIDIKAHLPGAHVNVSVANEWCTIDAAEDTLTVSEAITRLKDAHAANRPFYLAVGLHKPHMPWQFSAEDLAKHDLDAMTLPLHPYPPLDAPPIALHFTDEKAPHASPYVPISPNKTRAARRAYYAAVTGMDRKLGKLFDELDALGLTNNTAVVLHGDHGWQLGEHGEWRKFTNWELAARVPLIVRAPWIAASVGKRVAGLVELVDLLPSIAELAGVVLPADETFDGVSFVPLLLSGGGGGGSANANAKAAAFTQYPRKVENMSCAWKKNGVIHDDRAKFTHMGYSVRTAAWRYTEWPRWNGTTLKPNWTVPLAGVELYDHRNETVYPTDFDAGENVNVAAEVGNADVVHALSQLIRAQFPM